MFELLISEFPEKSNMNMIKTFETYNKKPKIGDWIIDTDDDIGLISGFGLDDECVVCYCGDGTTSSIIWRSDILHFGTKEEMEIRLQANKYNL